MRKALLKIIAAARSRCAYSQVERFFFRDNTTAGEWKIIYKKKRISKKKERINNPLEKLDWKIWSLVNNIHEE